MATPTRRRRRKPDSGPKIDPSAVTALVGDDEIVERARESVRKFRFMLPALNAYAKAVTKNNSIRVEMFAGAPCTDGKTIYMRPPIELGDELTHDRVLCEKRDDDGVLVCAACRSRENVDITVRHEIAHICFDSFAELTEEEKLELLGLALDEAGAADGSKRAAKIKARLDLMKPETYVEANAAISPFLPGIFNGLEDARVNISMYKARPGTYKMFRAQATEVFQEGLDRGDGTWVAWRDLPQNAQVVVGLYAKASGLDYKDWFDDEVVEVLNTPEITRYMTTVQNAKSARTIYKVGFPVLEALREHGFCVSDEDEDEEVTGGGDSGCEGEPTDEGGSSDGRTGGSDSSDEGDGASSKDDDGSESGKSGDSRKADAETDDKAPGGNDGEDGPDGPSRDDECRAETYEEAPGEGDGSDGDGEEGDDDGDDAAEGSGDADGDSDRGDAADVERALEAFGGHNDFGTPRPGGGVGPLAEHEVPATNEQREIDRAIVQGEFFDAPTRTVFGVNIWKDGDPAAPGWEPHSYADQSVEEAPESVLSPALQSMRVVFSDNRKARFERNLKAGRISARTLGRRVVVNDPRIFQKKREPGAKDYFVCIGMDISGSTCSNGRIQLTKAAAYAQAELLHRAGIHFAVYAHTGTRHGRGVGGYSAYSSSTVDVDIHVIKDPKEKWNAETKARLAALYSAQANLDGHSMEFYRKVCDREKATDKIILYYTDGQMPAENYNDELEVLQREIRDAPRRGIKIVGIGIQNEDPIEHGLDTIRIDRLEDVPVVVRALKERLIGE